MVNECVIVEWKEEKTRRRADGRTRSKGGGNREEGRGKREEGKGKREYESRKQTQRQRLSSRGWVGNCYPC